MKIVTISDTHNRHEDLIIPKGDMIIHAGDYSNQGSVSELYNFSNWWNNLDFKYKILVPGNHDIIYEKDWYYANNFAEALHDQMIIIEGLKIYGSAWQPKYGNWAFNLEHNEELREKWKLIPDEIDILITHGPPLGIKDLVESNNVGCGELLTRVLEIKPKVHIFGHIHEEENFGIEKIGETIFINTSMCYNRLRNIRTPLIIEV